MKRTIQDSVLTALKSGQELTSNQIASKFGAGNPGAVIQALRFAGTPVFLNKGPKGSKSKVYRTGKLINPVNRTIKVESGETIREAAIRNKVSIYPHVFKILNCIN